MILADIAGAAAAILIGLVLVAVLVWVLTNDQRRENEKRRATRKQLEQPES